MELTLGIYVIYPEGKHKRLPHNFLLDKYISYLHTYLKYIKGETMYQLSSLVVVLIVSIISLLVISADKLRCERSVS